MTDDKDVGPGADQPSSGDDQQSEGADQPSAGDDQPSAGTDQQNASADQPSAGADQQNASADQSSAEDGMQEEQPAVPAGADSSEAEVESSAEAANVAVMNPDDASEDDAEAEMMQMLDGLPEEGPGSRAEDIEFTSASASKAEFQQLQQPAGSPPQQNIELLMDVDLPVSIELGRTKMAIADILALGPGSVVELNKLAGEPVDLLVNYKVVARGEVVVVDENFGLRVTQLMTPEERLKALAEE